VSASPTGSGGPASGGELPRASALPAVATPKGGAAIRSIGEKFDVAPATGSGVLTVPLASSPGRAGFAPELSLSYDSGAGNGVFGFGWDIGLPSVSRKTDKGLPRYNDARESDVFVLSGAEDLVPFLDGAGDRVRTARTVHGVDYEIARYRPRLEGLNARIERWLRLDTGTSHWRTISPDNVTTLYGEDDDSRVADPSDARRVFTYLISRTFDDRGNLAVYGYEPEDARNIDVARPHEANRPTAARETQRYLKRVRFGFADPWFPTWSGTGAEPPVPEEWHFEVVLDYGDHDGAKPVPDPDRAWPVRPDPFSSHRGGFEVRTYRRCERALLFHHFPAEERVRANCLVRSTDITYSDETAPHDPRNPVYTFVESVVQTGYRRDGPGYRSRSLPPLEFEYSQPEMDPRIRTLGPKSAVNLPQGIDGTRATLADLDGEGLSGMLVDDGEAWHYKRNLSPLGGDAASEPGAAPDASFGPLEPVDPAPSLRGSGERLQLLDLAGDGSLDAVSLAGSLPGFYERTEDRGWQPFQPLARVPRIDWADPNLRFADLTGDGRADVLIAESGGFRFHPSLGEEGFGDAQAVSHPLDDDQGPRLVFADGTSTVFLADMCGDGLVDLVRVRNGDTCYWPNLGYGRFGPKVTMDDAPVLAPPEGFDPERVHLADIDGSGTADLIYEGPDGVVACFNRSGNSWAEPRTLAHFPSADELGSLEVTDLLGTGTACLVWSSPLPAAAGAPLRYVDLMGSGKPHLMVRSRNNLGSETRLRYAPSTRFMLADERAGKPWATRLPFPVHVVERVETYDWIGRSRFVTRYAYHHGHFDGIEREFRGFGMVEQWDTEEHRGEDVAFPDVEAVNWDAAVWSPPLAARTWFHTGAYEDADELSRRYAGEYWIEPDLRAEDRAADREAMLLPDTVLDPDIPAEERREACRALKGMTLRREVYARDGSDRQDHPYTVTEQNFEVTRVQERGPNRHAVFRAHPRESLDFDYERRPGDPRVSHDLTLEVDRFGNPVRRMSVAYPRRPGFGEPEPDLQPKFKAMLEHDQTRLHVSGTEERFTQALHDPHEFPDVHRTPEPSETIVAELTGVAPKANRPGATNLFSWQELDDAWNALWPGAHDTPYEEIPAGDLDGTSVAAGAPARRVVEHSRSLYRRDDLTGLLALHDLEPLALSGQTYRLALTPQLVERVLGDRAPAPVLTEAGYVKLAGSPNWWVPSERVFYSGSAAASAAQERAEARASFYLPRRSVDALGAQASVTYDDYDLMLVATVDAVGNTSRAENDYRVLMPWRTTDANGNRTETAFDALGLVVGSAVKGKKTESLGDSLDGFEPDVDEADMLAHLEDPLADPASMLQDASRRILYDLFAYHRTRDDDDPQPPAVYSLARETHAAGDPGGATAFDHAFAYSDGTGRDIQRKAQAAPGPVPDGPANADPRWVGSGWTIFDNKGNPVREYEPFFSATHQFEFARTAGVGTVLFYDPTSRVVATLHPDDSWEKVVFDNWRQEGWDSNDTVDLGDPRDDPDVGPWFRRFLGDAPNVFTSWHDRRISGGQGSTAAQKAAEKDAAEKAAEHSGTPSVSHLDSVGRTCLNVSDDGAGNRLGVRVALDAENKPLAVIDALGRSVTEYLIREPAPNGGVTYVAGYDIAGFGLYSASMDGAARRALVNVVGQPVRGWDGRGQSFRTRYDALQRPTHRYVEGPAGGEVLLERAVYGEGMAERNLCGQVFRQYDDAGVAISERHDFKGNLLESSRQLAADHHPGVDWAPLEELTDAGDLDAAAAPLLSADDRFVSTTAYDALNRPVQVVTPHSAGMRPNVLRPAYGKGGLPDGMDVWVRRASAPAGLLDRSTADIHAVTASEYNARAQRTRLVFENGTETTWEFDDRTFRLTRLRTERGASFPTGERVVQDLAYTYDPAGNITRIRDTADTQNVVFFRNRRVEPTTDYTYDALYRLTEARGREHLAQNGGGALSPPQQSDDDSGRIRLLHPGDVNAVGTYQETYAYDLAGNFEEIVHSVSSGSWRRRFDYSEPSQIDPADTCNRLSSSSAPGDPAGGPFSATYDYDEHGNAVRMPHLPAMGWDERDRLRSTTPQVVNAGTPETTWYGYDGGGQRIRKATDRQTAAGAVPSRRKERIHLGPIEVYREFAADGATVTLERETLHVDFAGQRTCSVETRTAGADPGPAQLARYQYSNHLGSTALELDAAAAIVSYEEYFPFGGTAYQAVRSATETPKRYRWSGKERDEESDFYHFGARYYAPWLGRWTSPDPLGPGDGTNLYAYSHGNPIRMNDPGGTGGDDFNDMKEFFEGLEPKDTRTHAQPGAAPLSRKEAKKAHAKQTKQYRQQHNMKGASVQAGHTAAKRHVKESGITAPDWDKQPMQQLHSRKGKGLDVTVTDKAGKKQIRTRHTSQEGLIDDAVNRVKKANGGKLTPQGQLDAAAEVEWRTQGTGMDQREVEAKRKSGLVDDSKPSGKKGGGTPDKGPAPDKAPAAAPENAKGAMPVADEAKAAKSEAKAVTAEAKALKAEAKAVKAEVKAVEKMGKGAKVLAKLGKAGRHIAAAVPLLGIAAGQASAGYNVSQGNYTEAVLDEAGFIPIAGDLLDAARAGVAIGEALDEGLGISDVATEHGLAVQGAAKSLGLGEDGALIAGAITAGVSSITVAPGLALRNTIGGLFK